MPIISSMGAGNKLDPTAFEVTDLYKTSVCPLARAMRPLCRKRGIRQVEVGHSPAPPAAGAAPAPGAGDTAPRTGSYVAGEGESYTEGSCAACADAREMGAELAVRMRRDHP